MALRFQVRKFIHATETNCAASTSMQYHEQSLCTVPFTDVPSGHSPSTVTTKITSCHWHLRTVRPCMQATNSTWVSAHPRLYKHILQRPYLIIRRIAAKHKRTVKQRKKRCAVCYRPRGNKGLHVLERLTFQGGSCQECYGGVYSHTCKRLQKLSSSTAPARLSSTLFQYCI